MYCTAHNELTDAPDRVQKGNNHEFFNRKQSTDPLSRIDAPPFDTEPEAPAPKRVSGSPAWKGEPLLCCFCPSVLLIFFQKEGKQFSLPQTEPQNTKAKEATPIDTTLPNVPPS